MALVVENGTGQSTAESYLSVADATTYLTAHGENTAWDADTTANQEIALRNATRYLDANFSGRWLGTRIQLTQALDWPRSGAVDNDGWYIDSASVPQVLKDATAVLASKAIAETLIADQSNAGVIGSEAKAIGPISKSVTYIGGKPLQKQYALAEMLIASIIEPFGVLERG